MRSYTLAAMMLLAVTAKAQVPDGYPPCVILVGPYRSIRLTRASQCSFLDELLIKPSLTNTMCLTLAENIDGASVVLRPCVGGADQKWIFRNGAVVAHGNKCLDVTEGIDANQTLLQGWSCDPAAPDPNQSWYYNVRRLLLPRTITNMLSSTGKRDLSGIGQINAWTCLRVAWLMRPRCVSTLCVQICC